MPGKKTLRLLNKKQKHYANLKRRPDENIVVGSKVLLCQKTLYIKKGSTKKLLPRYIGPLNISEEINPVAFKLDIPNRLRMHNVFHMSLLRVYKEGKYPRSPDILECIEGEYEYTVEKVADHIYVQSRKNTKVLEYLVKWKGYSSVNDSWEPSTRLSNCPEIVPSIKREMDCLTRSVQKHENVL
jgi:hypothetical protein